MSVFLLASQSSPSACIDRMFDEKVSRLRSGLPAQIFVTCTSVRRITSTRVAPLGQSAASCKQFCRSPPSSGPSCGPAHTDTIMLNGLFNEQVSKIISSKLVGMEAGFRHSKGQDGVWSLLGVRVLTLRRIFQQPLRVARFLTSVKPSPSEGNCKFG